jgi:hypothetical protein
MEITGTDKGLPVYYCENCELRERGSPVKEYYRKDGRLFERAYILRYSYKEGNTLTSDAGWFRTRRIIYEREAEDFPAIGQSRADNYPLYGRPWRPIRALTGTIPGKGSRHLFDILLLFLKKGERGDLPLRTLRISLWKGEQDVGKS